MIELNDSEFLSIVKRVHEERIKNKYYNPITDDENGFDEEIDFDDIPFGDLILDYAKSEDEAIIQRANDFIDIVYHQAEKQYRLGKSYLFNKIKKAGYTIFNNQKKVIDYVSDDHLISSERIGSDFAWQATRLMGFYKKEFNQDYTELTVTPINQEAFEIYMFWISQLSKKDNIKVTYHFSRYYTTYTNESNIFTLPCTIVCKKDHKNYRDGGVLRFEFTLPDTYSLERQQREKAKQKVEQEDNEIDKLVYNLNTFDVLDKIDSLDGYMFEKYCAKLLLANGYYDVSVTSSSRDQGIDIIAYKDKIKFGIQCKCYSSDVGNAAVQEANAGKMFYNCNVGVVLTNRYFTLSALDLAETIGIVLWDRSVLENMIKNAQTME